MFFLLAFFLIFLSSCPLPPLHLLPLAFSVGTLIPCGGEVGECHSQKAVTSGQIDFTLSIVQMDRREGRLATWELLVSLLCIQRDFFFFNPKQILCKI